MLPLVGVVKSFVVVLMTGNSEVELVIVTVGVTSVNNVLATELLSMLVSLVVESVTVLLIVDETATVSEGCAAVDPAFTELLKG